METNRLQQIEEAVLSLFVQGKTSRLLTKEVFQALPDYNHADLVRAFEDLEKSQRLVVRYTKQGHDWITLTPEGVESTGVPNDFDKLCPGVIPHPPKSSTSRTAQR